MSRRKTGNSEGLETHHKTPRVKGGRDEYKNLELVHISCHLEYHRIFPAKGDIPNDVQLRAGRKYIRGKKLAGLI
ncbi:HNH endonuclease [Bacillus cereus]|uniref:HNH endonuclease n=1 Tax=Bacillus cereus TaxID=1396 RepID=UPI00355B3E2E